MMFDIAFSRLLQGKLVESRHTHHVSYTYCEAGTQWNTSLEIGYFVTISVYDT